MEEFDAADAVFQSVDFGTATGMWVYPATHRPRWWRPLKRRQWRKSVVTFPFQSHSAGLVVRLDDDGVVRF
jgi:hypothetical protein